MYQKRSLSRILALVNLSVIAVTSAVFIGLSCGAHYYYFCALLLFLLVEDTDSICKYMLAAACVIGYFTMTIVFWESEPLYSLPGRLCL